MQSSMALCDLGLIGHPGAHDGEGVWIKQYCKKISIVHYWSMLHAYSQLHCSVSVLTALRTTFLDVTRNKVIEIPTVLHCICGTELLHFLFAIEPWVLRQVWERDFPKMSSSLLWGHSYKRMSLLTLCYGTYCACWVCTYLIAKSQGALEMTIQGQCNFVELLS